MREMIIMIREMKSFSLFFTFLIVLCLISCGHTEELNIESEINERSIEEDAEQIKIEGSVFEEDLNYKEIMTESFFFFPNIEKQRVNISSTIPCDLPDKMDLLVNHIASYSDGNLYELQLDYSDEILSRNYDGWDRRNLGYFYVEGSFIYRIREDKAEDINTWSEDELKTKGVIVCQDSPMNDKFGPEEKGFHETIDIDGNYCIYESYYNNVETDFFETFIWKKGKGLVEYYSGYGALSFYLNVRLSDNECSNKELVTDMENAYGEFLNNQLEVSYVAQSGRIREATLWKLPGFVSEKECWYFYVDIDGDGWEELHVRIPFGGIYYIIKYEEDGLKVIYTDESGCEWPVYHGLCYDQNGNGKFDIEDKYFYIENSGKKIEIEMEEWLRLSEVYYLKRGVRLENWNIKKRG